MRTLMTAFGLALAAPAALTSAATQVWAQDAIRTERVGFRPGQSSAVLVRTIRGREAIDFVVNARAGQRLAASMTSDNTAAYFNIIAPGETDVAFYAGSSGNPLNSYVGVVPASGDLKFRVYLYRAAARRGERAAIRLNISITGAGDHAAQLPGDANAGGEAAAQLPGDALVPGTPYHATGQVSCTANAGARPTDCPFGVVRLGGGSAAVTVTRPGGRTRTIVFRLGAPVGFDQGPGEPAGLSVTREGFVTIVRIGGERYTIPDEVLFGG